MLNNAKLPESPSKKTRTFKKFISYYKPYKLLLTINLLSAAVYATLGLALPLCVRYITNDILQSGTQDVLPEILRVGGLMLGIILFMTACSIFYDYKGHDMGAKIERDIRSELFEHYQKMSFSFYDDRNTGELMSRLSNDLHGFSEICHHVPENILIYGIQVIGSFVILFIVDWRLALVICAIMPFMIVYAFIYYKKLQKSYKENRKCISDVNEIVQESLSGIRMTKSFTGEDSEIKKFNIGNNKYYKSRSGIYKSEAMFYSVVGSFFTPLFTVAIAVAGGIWISGNSLNIANLLMFIMYAAYLTGPVPQLAGIMPFYQEGFSGYNRFREIMDTAPEILDTTNAIELKDCKGHVEFKDVTFRYGGKHEYVLHNINLDVRHGETVAIVGRSGIGKTTLCSLVPRFYEVSEGAVYIDGTDIRSVTQKSLRRQIGIVRQDTFLFSGTVLENILYGKPGATKEDAVDAAKQANAHSFIMELPDSYDTDIGQRGVKLSGGQQQRINIARVFLKNPPIIIFDEATSALDYESERAVMDNLKTLTAERTTFIIAHRLSTVKNADRIIVLGNEGITEQGTHEQLYESDSVYAKLYNAQDTYLLNSLSAN